MLGLALLLLFYCLPTVGQQQPSPHTNAPSQAGAQPGGSGSNQSEQSIAKVGDSTTQPSTAVPDLKPDAHGNLSQEQMQQLFRVVAEKDLENDKKLRDYTYIELDEEHKLDGKGKVRSTESETFEVIEI